MYTPVKLHDGQFVMEATGDKSCVICVGSTVSGQIFVKLKTTISNLNLNINYIEGCWQELHRE